MAGDLVKLLQSSRERILADMVAQATVALSAGAPAPAIGPAVVDPLAAHMFELTLDGLHSPPKMVSDSVSELIQSAVVAGRAADVVDLFLCLKRVIFGFLQEADWSGLSVEVALTISDVIDRYVMECHARLIRSFGGAVPARELDRRAQTLPAIAQVAGSTLNLRAMLQALTKKIVEELEVERATFWLPDERMDTIADFVTYGVPEHQLPILDSLKGRPIAEFPIGQQLLETTEPIVIPDAARGDLIPSDLADALGMRATMCVPLKSGEEKIAALFLDTSFARRFTAEDVALAKAIGQQAILAIENARLYERLAASEEKYRSIFEKSVVGIYQSTPEGELLAANLTMAQMLGYESVEELLQVKVMDLFADPAGLTRWRAQIEQQGILQSEGQLRRRDGSLIWVRDLSRTVRDPGGQVLSYVGTMMDITERKQVEEALRESEDRYRDLVEHSQDLICTHDLEGRILSANQAVAELLGYDPKDYIGKKNVRDILVPEVHDQFDEYLATIKRDGVADGLMLVQTSTGERRIWEYHNTLRTEGIAAPIVRGMARDITDRKRAEEQLKASLREKEVLLKEIHHRVKNNLQIISSLLYLQAEEATEERSHQMFQESQDRIRAMALIHEQMYHSKDLVEVDFAGYIHNLATHLFRSYGVNSNAIALRVSVADVSVGLDTAIPCGLIVNELVSNCLKHAFPGGRTGDIYIELRAGSEGQIRLSVSDNGIGFPPGVDFRNSSSLGLKLVNALVTQLKGRITLRNTGRTEFEIALTPVE
jgi:PAS domain S-box-containing protein